MGTSRVFREDLILPLIEGRDVLDCGAADHYFAEEKMAEDCWLHAKVALQARSCTGIDILEDRVEELNRLGPYNFLYMNAETMTFRSEFDVVLAGEFIEHLFNPGLFLSSARNALRPDGLIVLTTPNAYRFTSLVKSTLTGREYCHPEHTCYFSEQ